MDKLSQLIVALCVISLFLWLFSTLEPWIDEDFGEKIEKPIKSDVELCGKYTPYRGKDDVLLCQCEHNKSKPGKCEEKYK